MAVVSQSYVTHVNQEYVILGNAIVMKCGIPSFVADFVFVTGWQEDVSGSSFLPSQDYGSNLLLF